jgi:putative transposase
MLQQRGVYLSASVIYGHLKAQGQLETLRAAGGAVEESPLRGMAEKSDVGKRLDETASGWGCRYLLTVVDFFSRWIIAWEVVPTVNARKVKAIYQRGLKNQGISIRSETKPELRVDWESPNTSAITQEFFEFLAAELSFARVRRPTDNVVTERFYRSIKQEEIYLVRNYPDEIPAKEEIGRYIENYHHCRPHQSLMNFTPANVHQVNTKAV